MMSKEQTDDDKNAQDGGEVSERQMLLKIVELASTDDLPEEALREMVEALKKIVDKHKGKEN
jgi:phytoene/squalene synthetase